ncbi:Peptidase E [Serratia quinivorans]|jgi:dipeptidase E|uniref:dipeptidase PepE n=1 Tax=Serratia quinivorans TaxID=137545 RepID=UPI00217B7746|nr:dipeptidase PepE [Serratia quinivorans]CAI1891013.1 Peptidase E [Serratia quinivorans]CAI1995841.1 Peptidase E [Serratia quinivorans]CAI2137402.1 Peptidase E [Serratia quinivorans]CAI2144882.1 Peptidase E [Serratia quinivorans]CAI2397905.1 Peptidase E [Serratia quinivorans]
MKKVLLMSSSRQGNQGYLEHAGEQIHALLQHQGQQVLFVPYAAVTFSFDDYEARVKPVFGALGYGVNSIHRAADPLAAVNAAQAIAIGGGNTWALLRRMYDADLVAAIRSRVLEGVPYIGWSAGSNVACPTIRTTNDMPIIAPPTFDALNLVPFQINPHFISGKPPGHNGETREERLAEFLAINPQENLLALPEGSALLVEDDRAKVLGEQGGIIFTLQGDRKLPVGQPFDLSSINGAG